MSNSTHRPEMFIVLNPNAAKGKAASQRQAIERWFSERDIPVRMVLTERPFDAIKLSKNAVHAGYRTIIAAGGDGTVNEVVDGVIRATRELGLAVHESLWSDCFRSGGAMISPMWLASRRILMVRVSSLPPECGRRWITARCSADAFPMGDVS